MYIYYGTKINYWLARNDRIIFGRVTNRDPYSWRKEKEESKLDPWPIIEQRYHTFSKKDNILSIKSCEVKHIVHIINILLFVGYELNILPENIVINKDISTTYNWEVHQKLLLQKLVNDKKDGVFDMSICKIHKNITISDRYDYNPLVWFLIGNVDQKDITWCHVREGIFVPVYTDDKFHQ